MVEEVEIGSDLTCLMAFCLEIIWAKCGYFSHLKKSLF